MIALLFNSILSSTGRLAGWALMLAVWLLSRPGGWAVLMVLTLLALRVLPAPATTP